MPNSDYMRSSFFPSSNVNPAGVGNESTLGSFMGLWGWGAFVTAEGLPAWIPERLYLDEQALFLLTSPPLRMHALRTQELGLRVALFRGNFPGTRQGTLFISQTPLPLPFISGPRRREFDWTCQHL